MLALEPYQAYYHRALKRISAGQPKDLVLSQLIYGSAVCPCCSPTMKNDRITSLMAGLWFRILFFSSRSRRSFTACALPTYLVLLFLCSILVAQQAKQPTPAKPTKEQIAHWLEQLGDNDFDKREEASRKLWEAGELAEVAVREAVKSTDPEVKRRARELLDKFKWGIYPTTPKAIVELIGRYHGQDKVEAVRGLLEAGPAGCKSLLKILAAEDTPEAKKVLQDVIVAELPRSVPQLLARNDFTTLETLLNTGMAGDNPAGLRHAAAYWLLRGQLDQKIKHYRALEARGDKATAKANAEILACLYRARGDFVAARGAARRAGREDLVDAMLYEAGDWNEDAWRGDDAQIVRPTARRPGKHPPKYEKLGFRTACKRLTGTPQEFEAAVGEVLKLADNLKPDDETDRFSLAAVLLFNHRPKEALDNPGQERCPQCGDWGDPAQTRPVCRGSRRSR